MIRSRLFFLLLLLSYIGVTPVGVYTCACLVPSQPSPILAAAEWDHLPEEWLLSDTAVPAIISFLTLPILMVAALAIISGFSNTLRFLPSLIRPDEFKNLPPTPPPQMI